MEDSLPVHTLDRSKHLKHKEFYALIVEGIAPIFQALVQIHIHQLENQCQLACVRTFIPLGSS